MEPLTQSRLLEVVSYSQETGLFTRKIRTCNKVKVGDMPNCLNSEGYIHFRVYGQLHKAHRLAWLAVTGRPPVGQIDHINGDRKDNRFCNLREVTNSQNQQNRRNARKDNKSSTHMGVGHYKGKWRSRIQIDKKSVWLGLFDTEADAVEAYKKAKSEMHPYSPEQMG